MSFKLTLRSYSLLNGGDLLPWLIGSLGILILTQGGWQQPTALGFFSLVAGLWIASMKTRSAEIHDSTFHD